MIFSCNFPNEYSSANTAALDKADTADKIGQRILQVHYDGQIALELFSSSSLIEHANTSGPAVQRGSRQTPIQEKTIAASRPAGNKYGWNMAWSSSSGL